jgi:activating signal cointegrator complex subunit 1
MEDNILNPELIWIGSRCYRINIPSEKRQEEIIRVNYEEDDFEIEYDDEDCLEIEAIDGGKKFQFKLHIPQQFHGQIIGPKGTSKKRLEQGEQKITNFNIDKFKTSF